MSTARNDYLHLLRCALWDVRPDLERMIDWNDVLRLAQRQTTLGIVGNAALQSRATQALLSESRVRLPTHLEKMQDQPSANTTSASSCSRASDWPNIIPCLDFGIAATSTCS